MLRNKTSELQMQQPSTPMNSDRDAQRTATDSFCFQASDVSKSTRGADNMRVLVVDDQSIIRRMLRKALERRGAVVDEACDGKEALDRLKQMQYDCVLSGSLAMCLPPTGNTI